MIHRLELDFREGVLFASCTCGEWRLDRIPIASEPLSAVHDRIEAQFNDHVEACAETP